MRYLMLYYMSASELLKSLVPSVIIYPCCFISSAIHYALPSIHTACFSLISLTLVIAFSVSYSYELLSCSMFE